MLFVLTGQLTFGSLDDACTNEQVLHRACNQITHSYIHLNATMYSMVQ